VRERLQKDDCAQGFILDGFPRTVPQADALKLSLRELNRQISSVVSLEVDTEALVARLTGRRTCRQCGRGYHVAFDPPLKDGVCDSCGGELYQRDDDQESTIRNRLQVYRDQTAPLVAYYEQDGLVAAVDGMQDIDVVREDILAALGTA
jgi:adenylate kinase